jgi:hypothetical protein
MADELTMAGSITYTGDDGRTRSIEVPECMGDTTKLVIIEQTIATSETAVNLGGISSPTAFMIVNLDDTNYVEVKVATSGAIFAKLKKDTDGDGNGGFACLTELGSGAQAPYAIANTAACNVLVLVAE